MWTFLNPTFLYALAAGLVPLVLQLRGPDGALLDEVATE